MQAAEELRAMMAGEAAGGVDPTMAMFIMMQKQMQQQIDMLADKLADLGGGRAGAGLHGGGGHGGGGAGATRSRKMEAPRLKPPEEATLVINITSVPGLEGKVRGVRSHHQAGHRVRQGRQEGRAARGNP